jgi:adenylosuccinate lyase
MTPLTDRYKDKTENFTNIFSERKYLSIIFEIEMMWLESISEEILGKHATAFIKKHKPAFSYEAIKKIEENTRHDVASVFTYIQEYYSSLCDFENQGVKISQMVHFGLTSQDLVSVAYATMSRMANDEILSVIEDKKTRHNLAKLYKSHDRLVGFTHGQIGTPISTRNLVDFLLYSDKGFDQIVSGLRGNVVKSRFLSGSCGDRYSLKKTLSEDTMTKALNAFEKKYKQTYQNKLQPQLSRQSDNYPQIINSLDTIKWMFMWIERESRNLWLYASHGLVCRERNMDEVGSSTMSQKVNPILFENAEGNCKIGLAIADVMVRSMFDTRLDRDLSDLTVIRNLGLIYGHLAVALESFTKGCEIYNIDGVAVEEMLSKNHQCLAETVNLVLRKNLYPNSYVVSKNMFMGIPALTRKDYEDVIKKNIKNNIIKKELLKLEI